MFGVSKKELNREIEHLERSIEDLKAKYWTLETRFLRLMNHLGLEEHSDTSVKIREIKRTGL